MSFDSQLSTVPLVPHVVEKLRRLVEKPCQCWVAERFGQMEFLASEERTRGVLSDLESLLSKTVAVSTDAADSVGLKKVWTGALTKLSRK